mmetsp:Transcript_34068/g.90794  ORF Transcript_34068/g.90794 Transcript_34068/m.90794 type:complete len:441 (-) Transcript_34068:622-1944(-)
MYVEQSRMDPILPTRPSAYSEPRGYPNPSALTARFGQQSARARSPRGFQVSPPRSRNHFEVLPIRRGSNSDTLRHRLASSDNSQLEERLEALQVRRREQLTECRHLVHLRGVLQETSESRAAELQVAAARLSNKGFRSNSMEEEAHRRIGNVSSEVELLQGRLRKLEESGSREKEKVSELEARNRASRINVAELESESTASASLHSRLERSRLDLMHKVRELTEHRVELEGSCRTLLTEQEEMLEQHRRASRSQRETCASRLATVHSEEHSFRNEIQELGSRVSQATRSGSAERRRLADLERELAQLQDTEASELRHIESELAWSGERKRQLASESQMAQAKSTELSNLQPRLRLLEDEVSDSRCSELTAQRALKDTERAAERERFALKHESSSIAAVREEIRDARAAQTNATRRLGEIEMLAEGAVFEPRSSLSHRFEP